MQFLLATKHRRYWLAYLLAVFVLWLVQIALALTGMVRQPAAYNLTLFLFVVVVSLPLSVLVVGLVCAISASVIWIIRRMQLRRWLVYLLVWVLGFGCGLAYIGAAGGSYGPSPAPTRPAGLAPNFRYPGRSLGPLEPTTDAAMVKAGSDAARAAESLRLRLASVTTDPDLKWNRDQAEIEMFKAEAEVSNNPSPQAAALAALLPRVKEVLIKVDREELAKLQVELGRIK